MDKNSFTLSKSGQTLQTSSLNKTCKKNSQLIGIHHENCLPDLNSTNQKAFERKCQRTEYSVERKKAFIYNNFINIGCPASNYQTRDDSQQHINKQIHSGTGVYLIPKVLEFVPLIGLAYTSAKRKTKISKVANRWTKQNNQ